MMDAIYAEQLHFTPALGVVKKNPQRGADGADVQDLSWLLLPSKLHLVGADFSCYLLLVCTRQLASDEQQNILC